MTETLTLHCFHEVNLAMHFLLYKQPFGNNPQLMSTFYEYENNYIFYDFKGNPRVSLESGNGINHLKISDVQLSDSAAYYCVSFYSNLVEFGGDILIVKGTKYKFKEKITSYLWTATEGTDPETLPLYSCLSQSSQETLTLNCTIDTETYAGEHSVYWFRHGSGQSHPGIIYTHGDRSDQYEKSPEAGSPTQSCVYNPPKRNLRLSDVGTYYCGVASCGVILFWNGTKLNIEFDHYPVLKILVLLSIIRTGVLLCCLTIFIIYLIRK
ncbi:uncharacterized protein LOC129835446 [Salvelinus fontinalis]|uniref:uncharacterized protein LOC129835446 n=1 Tax=Salvelinus fontinalis TaxID=8038 RepID=UPI0024857809|nr:uncharacterized protein LOC129835446 [Salvelinus fontinalis]